MPVTAIWHIQPGIRCKLKSYGAFQRDLSHKKLPEQPVLTSDSLFYMNYDLKVQNWYGGSLNQ